ncbi:MAG: SLC13 family permease [Lentisphaeria bacterium]
MIFWIATIIFVGTYALIASEKVNKTSTAVAGAMLMLLFVMPNTEDKKNHNNHQIEQSTIIENQINHSPQQESQIIHSPKKEKEYDSFAKYVNFDVFFTLAGMMLLVNILSSTGLFQYVAIKAAKIARGLPINTLLLLVIATAILSAFLDNVTTILLIAPVTLVVASELGVSPIPFLMAETMASNIGGTATLIGDPPNLIIGSHANLSFSAFMINLAPFILLILGLYCVILYFYYHKKMTVTVERRARIMEFKESEAITDMKTLKKAGTIMVITLIGFLLHGALHLEPCVVAMSGGAAALFFCCKDVEHALEKIEWVTLFFFLGLFILVEGADKAGLMSEVGKLLNLINNWPPLLIITILIWVCGTLAAIMNNVSFTAAAVVIIGEFITNTAPFNTDLSLQHTLWWALALAVCLGGNGSAVGAAANLVTIGIAEKGGCKLTFKDFLRYGLPVTIVTLALSNLYIVARYYLIH